MVIGYGKIVFRLHGCRTLKEKRSLIRTMISRMRREFNLSAAETEANDQVQKAEIGFSFVGNDSGVINAKMDKLLNFIESLGLAEIADVDSEIQII